MKLQITREEIDNDTFLDDDEKKAFWPWIESVIERYPEHNTHEKLLEYLHMYKEMCFQSS